jgi:hypothetical protein
VANIQYSDLIDEVLPQLAADPSDPVTEQAIKRAVIEFCRESWIWQFFPEAQNVRSGVAEYDIEPPSGADVVTVVDVECNRVPLTPKSVAWLNKETPGWRTTGAAIKHYTQIDTDQLILAPLPAENITSGLAMTVALQPSQSATSFPKWIANQFIYQIADGAIAKLMLMPNKPWTDLVNGQDHRTRFEQAFNDARESAISALGRAAVRVSAQH